MSNKQKNENGRWLMVLVVVVSVAVVGVIAWNVATRRASPPRGVQTVEGITNELPSAPASSETPLSSVPASTPEEPVLPPTAPVGTSVGQSAPDFTLDDLNGESVSLHQFRGHVVILDFWASWCPPCRSSMPTLEKFAAEYHDKGLVLIGVSLDRSASDASSFLDENDYDSLIALWESVSASQGVARTYGVSAIPHTFVIDRDGIIHFSDHPMRLSESALDKLFQ